MNINLPEMKKYFAEALGTAIAADIWKDQWGYWIGPVLGPASTAKLFKFFHST